MKIGQDIFVQQGILDCQIDQLIEYSQTDSDIQKFTSDKARFANKDSFHQWLLKGRIIYTLTDKDKNLFGIIWFGAKTPPIKLDSKYNFTFSIRIYSLARGQGLSQEFTKIAFKDLLKNQSKSQITGFWLETSKDNFAAIHSYQKFGFKTISSPDYNNKIIMTLDSATINYEIKN
jgi:ribosomal protein S18 acetylase RimI-like enzyme